jgi:hypothetical protein
LVQRLKQWFKSHPWDAVLMFAAGLVGLLTGLWASVIILDDAMITFRVAENLAYGRGFVYNVGERVQVTTTPLYAMILVPGVWLLGSAPRVALALNILLSALIPILAYDLGRRLSGRITGVGGALLLTLAPLLIIAFSMESYLYVTLILASLDAYAARRWRLAGVLTGLTALVRGDGVLLGACLLGYDVVAQRRLRWRLIIPVITIPAIWYMFAMLYYHSPFPATLSAKTAQGEFNWLGKRFADGFWAYWDDWIRKEDYDAFYLFPLLMGLGILPVIWRERAWLILIGYSLLYVTAFITLGVPTAEWYYAPLMPGAALLTARGVQVIAETLTWLIKNTVKRGGEEADRIPQLIATSSAIIVIIILLATLYPISAKIIAQHPDWKALVYPDIARWIAQNTSTSANLATIDIGHLGYWSGRPIIDIVGLAQPDVAPHIADGDFGYAIRHYQPNLVLIGYAWLPEVQTTPWFQADYAPRHYFKSQIMDAPLVLFSRRVGVKVQPEPVPPTAEIQPMDVDFNRQIRLTGYHVNQPLNPGDPLNLTLFWQAKAPIAIDFTVFVQLVDSQNNILAQADDKPQNGLYTTNYWQPGETILDLHTVSLPGDLPAGHYDLLLGFYEAETGQRLQILDEAGVFKSDYLRLTGIQVQAPQP